VTVPKQEANLSLG